MSEIVLKWVQRFGGECRRAAAVCHFYFLTLALTNWCCKLHEIVCSTKKRSIAETKRRTYLEGYLQMPGVPQYPPLPDRQQKPAIFDWGTAMGDMDDEGPSPGGQKGRLVS